MKKSTAVQGRHVIRLEVPGLATGPKLALSRAITDRQLATEVLEQGIQNALAFFPGG